MEGTRRALLAAAGTAAAGALAGCSGGETDAETPEDGDGGDGGGARLAYLRAANRDDAAHTVHVLVQRGGDPVHWSSHDLSADGDGTTASVSTDWEGSESPVVHVRLDGESSWSTFDLGERAESCYGVEARVDAGGDLSVWYEVTPDGCETGTATP
jgi:hypothetical protein